MNGLRLRILLPLCLFGFLPAMGAARLQGLPLDWFFGNIGVLLGGGVFLAAYLLSGWVLKPTTAVMKATTSILRGVPPETKTSEWLPSDFWKLRCDINMIFAKQRQALDAAETHACQTGQRLLNAERLLREAFTALQGIFSASDEGVAVIDVEGNIVASNGRMDEFLGDAVEDLESRESAGLMSAIAGRFEKSEDAANWLAKASEIEDPKIEFEGRVIGEAFRVFALRTSPMVTESGENIGRLWIVRDQSNIRALEGRLREAQKLGNLGQLAGGIAHDFNNMLTAIRGNLTMAEMTPGATTPDVRDKLHGASQATTRAAHLVKSLLSYSRRGDGKSQRLPTNLKRVVGEVEGMLKHSIDPRVTIRVRAGMDASNVIGDAAQLEQVLLNLCLNARDALPAENGIIEIGIENVTQPAGQGMARAELGDYAVICVRDNGHGVPEEDKLRVFEPFFTTKPSGKGTGLGLSMAQDIVREHGGWIEFESEVGRGTEFRIYLPRTAEMAADDLEDGPEEPVETNGVEAAVATTVGRRGTVLVVDDEAAVRSIAVNMLNFLGYRVVQASDGQQALEIVLGGREEIDAMLLDIYMPRLSGRETFKQMRAAGCDLPVVICSGFVIDPDEFVVLGEGRTPPVDIMLKPYSLDALGRALAKATGKEQAPASPPAINVPNQHPALVS